MSWKLRVILLVGSFISFVICVRKIKSAKLKVENSITWMSASLLLVLMSVFENVVNWISSKLGFMSPVNFVYVIIILFLIIQTFIDNLRIVELNEKIKNLDHYIALKEHEEENKETRKE